MYTWANLSFCLKLWFRIKRKCVGSWDECQMNVGFERILGCVIIRWFCWIYILFRLEACCECTCSRLDGKNFRTHYVFFIFHRLINVRFIITMRHLRIRYHDDHSNNEEIHISRFSFLLRKTYRPRLLFAFFFFQTALKTRFCESNLYRTMNKILSVQIR